MIKKKKRAPLVEMNSRNVPGAAFCGYLAVAQEALHWRPGLHRCLSINLTV